MRTLQKLSGQRLLTFRLTGPSVTANDYKEKTIIFLTGGGRGVGKICNKLFAEDVNTEINCMQVKKSVCRQTETHPKNCLQQEPHIKKSV